MVNASTWSDALGCLRGVFAFLPLLLAPGYCVAWAVDFLGFRGRTLGERLSWGVAFSFGLTTIAAVELAKFASLSAVCWFAAICAAAFLIILAVDLWRHRPATEWSRPAIVLAAVWIAFVVLELMDVGIGNRLYLSVTVYDHSMRTAFVDSVLRTGVPPANPLFWPGHAAPMRYYYFWYVLCGAAARLGHVTARQAMIASVVWAGFGLGAIIVLYCRHFLSVNRSGGTLFGARRWPRLAVAVGLLAVTGLDILPVLVKAIARMPTDPDMEWWGPDQVTSWIDSLLWVPHHIAGLVCCLFGFLLVWISKGMSPGRRVGCAVVAGLAFASAFGLTTWVALAFAILMLIWMLWAIWLEYASRPRLPVLLGAGLVAMLALAPYLAELRAAPRSASGAAVERSISDNARDLLRFGVRHPIDPEPLLRVPGVSAFAKAHPRTEDAVAGLILLLPGYFVELGLYGLVLVAAFVASRRSGIDEAVRTSLMLASTGLVLSTFLRSTVIQNNDFGFRSILIAQFFLLLLAVMWCEGAFGETKGSMRTAMQGMLWLGLAGSVYQIVELRLYLPVEDALRRPDVSGLAERAMVWGHGFEVMDRRVPRDAVVQFNLDQPSEVFRFPPMMMAGRQMASGYSDCLSAFGGDPAACPRVMGGIARLFGGQERGGAVRDACHRLGIQYLVATRWDDVWFDPQSWVWMLPAVVHTGDLRVVDCVTTLP